MDLVDYNSANILPNHSDPKISTDLSLGYALTDNVRVVFNGTNIFNVYPNKQNPNDTETGGMYEPVQMGFAGRFLSLHLKLKF